MVLRRSAATGDRVGRVASPHRGVPGAVRVDLPGTNRATSAPAARTGGCRSATSRQRAAAGHLAACATEPRCSAPRHPGRRLLDGLRLLRVAGGRRRGVDGLRRGTSITLPTCRRATPSGRRRWSSRSPTPATCSARCATASGRPRSVRSAESTLPPLPKVVRNPSSSTTWPSSCRTCARSSSTGGRAVPRPRVTADPGDDHRGRRVAAGRPGVTDERHDLERPRSSGSSPSLAPNVDISMDAHSTPPPMSRRSAPVPTFDEVVANVDRFRDAAEASGARTDIALTPDARQLALASRAVPLRRGPSRGSGSTP